MKLKQQKKDYLHRQPVLAQVVMSSNEEHLDDLINERLPEHHIRSGKIFQFPAGYLKSYRINNKDYNFRGDRSLEEQKELIETDLMAESFTEDEIQEFLQEIEIETSEMPAYLSLDDSRKWLKEHPKYEQEALRLLDEVKRGLHNERSGEIRSQIKKK